MNPFIDHFRHSGYFEYPIVNSLKKDLSKLAEYWRLFYEQPLSEKEKHIFSDYVGGYEYKGPESLDYKENFHLSLKYKIPENSTSLVDFAFLTSAKKFISSSWHMIVPMIEIMDQATDSNMASLLIEDNFTLRFLHYFPREGTSLENNFLAAPHIDKGVTIHFYEDHPGLQVLWGNQWNKVYHNPDNVHGYFGMLGQLYSNCGFPALCHRVVPTPKTIKYGRTSIVLFIDFGDKIYNKEKFGSTQKVFPNGENYNMPIEDFSKYFINQK